MLKSLAGFLMFCAFVSATYAGEVRLGVERPLTPIFPGPSAHEDKYPPQVASNGREFFAVWTEERRGSMNVYGTRIGQDGQPRDPQGLHLVDGFHNPVIASSGNGYLIAWDGLDGTRTQRLDDNGTAVAPPRLIGSYQPVALISNGSSYLLVTYDPHSTSRSAVVLDRDGVPSGTFWSLNDQFVACGVHNGSYVIVVDQTSDYGTLPALYTITESGSVTYTPLPKLRNVVNLTAAFSRDGILLAWQREQSLEANSKPAGYLLADYYGRLQTAVDFDNPVQSLWRSLPVAWWDGTEFAVIFSPGPESIVPIRISAAGKVLDSTPFALNVKYSTGGTPVFASADTVQIILWLGYEFGREPNITGRTFTGFAVLESSETKLITYSGRAQSDVRVARAGAHEIVAWVEPAERVFVSVDGVAIPVDGVWLPIAGVPERAVGPPAVAAGNESFLVVRPAPAELLAVRITFDGRIIDTVPIVLSDHAPQRDWFSDAAIAFDGTAFLVTWTQDQDVFTARLPEERSVRTRTLSTFPIDAVSGGIWLDAHSPQVVWTGSGFFLAYSLGQTNYANYHYHPAAMAGLRIDTSRVPSPPTKTLFDFLGNGEQPLAMAAGGGTSTLVWYFDDRVGHGIAMAQVGDDGGPRPAPRTIAYTPFPLLPPFVQCMRPAVPSIAWNGAEFVVAWTEGVSCAETIVRAIRISRNGDPLDDAPFDVAAGSLASTSIVPTSEGVDIVYSRDDEANGDAPRAFARSLARLPPSLLRRRAAR